MAIRSPRDVELRFLVAEVLEGMGVDKKAG
jgi:hypothetical protein